VRLHPHPALSRSPDARLRVGLLDPGTRRPEVARVVRTLYDALRTFDHHVVVWSIPAGDDDRTVEAWIDRQDLDLVLDVGPRSGGAPLPVPVVAVPRLAGWIPDRPDAVHGILDLHPVPVDAGEAPRWPIGWGVSPTFLRSPRRGDDHPTFVLELPEPGHDELLDVVLLAFQEISRVLEDVSLLVRAEGFAGREETRESTVFDGAESSVRMERIVPTAPFDGPGRILVHVTPKEGFLTPVAEAMACGLAVIVPDDPVFAAYVEDDHTGLRVRTAPAEGGGLRLDAVDLAERMLRAARSPREVDRLGRNAAREARRTLSFRAFAERLDGTLRAAVRTARAA